MATDQALFFTCSLIEFIGRETRRSRREVVSLLGERTVRQIYEYSDVLHCEVLEAVAERYIKSCRISSGGFDNVAACRYAVPTFWTMGKVFAWLIAELDGGQDVVGTLLKVYSSWIADALSDYNSDLFYQSTEYLAGCFKAGRVLCDDVH